MNFVLNLLILSLLLCGVVVKEEWYTLILGGCISLYYFYLFIRKPKFFMKFSWILVYNFSNILGMLIIEFQKLDLYEIGMVSYYTGISSELILINFLFILGLQINWKNPEIRIEYKQNKEKIFLMIMILIFGILLFDKYDKVAPIIGVSRVVYRKIYLSAIEDKIMRNIIILVPLVSIIMFQRKNKKQAIGLSILIVLYFLAIGHKFGIFSYIFYFLIFPIIELIEENKFKKIKTIFVSIVISLVIIAGISVKWSYGYDTDQIKQYLYNRISQQGQLWFAIQTKKELTKYNFKESLNEIKNIGKIRLKEEDKKSTGMYKIMKEVMDEDRFEERFENKLVLAYGAQPLFYYYFGYFLTCLIFLCLGYIYSFLIKKATESVRSFKIIDTLLIVRLLQMYNATIIQGDIYRILSLDSLIIYIYFIIKRIINNCKNSKKLKIMFD